MSRERIETGRRGERLAEKQLKKKGFRLAERNLRNKAGEIDLLMWDGEELVIVEVRTVTDAHGLDISDRIPISKRRQLVRLANHLLASFEDEPPPIRFDVVLVELDPKPVFHHVTDAFQPGDVGNPDIH